MRRLCAIILNKGPPGPEGQGGIFMKNPFSVKNGFPSVNKRVFFKYPKYPKYTNIQISKYPNTQIISNNNSYEIISNIVWGGGGGGVHTGMQ